MLRRLLWTWQRASLKWRRRIELATDYGFALPSQEDTALHHTRSPKCSGSLLRGSLAITTSGLSPVSHQKEGDVHRTLQTKFTASFVLPTPVYCATCG
jgi:hypothetical protein